MRPEGAAGRSQGNMSKVREEGIKGCQSAGSGQGGAPRLGLQRLAATRPLDLGFGDCPRGHVT